MPPATLPDRLSDLLDAAVDDSEALEHDSRYRLAMSDWHLPFPLLGPPAICEVCMAGAVMAQRLRAPFDCVMEPEDYNPELAGKLRAIDRMRAGAFDSAALRIGLTLAVEVNSDPHLLAAFNTAREIVKSGWRQAEGRAEWSSYREAAAVLRSAGL